MAAPNSNKKSAKPGRGGPRPNSGGSRARAGRKTDAAKVAIRELQSGIDALIVPELPRLIDNLLRMADGIYREQVMPDGKANIYQDPPSFKANTYLIDRVLGKPTISVRTEEPDEDERTIRDRLAAVRRARCKGDGPGPGGGVPGQGGQ